jgi:hypothetical protein
MSSILRGLNEGMADDFMAMAKARGMNARVAGTPEQERERTNQMLAQRATDREQQAIQSAANDAKILPQLKAEYDEVFKKYNSLGGRNWQYADREQNLTSAEREARSLEPKLNDLSRRIHAASKGITEADEWEEETGKHQRFVEYAKKTLMSERDPKRRIETANYLSKQENKFFGSPISSSTEPTKFGSVNTGKAFTDLIKGIMSDIQDGRLHYEQDALNAAIWLEPEGKEFLQKAHTDFIDMMDHSRKEREQHAIALSGYQTKNLGGKVMGAPLKGGIVNDASARMTPEIFGVFELAEKEILRQKGEREDEQERQRNIAIWNALPGPLKFAAAAAIGKTPDQLEKILFAKSEIDAVAGLDANVLIADVKVACAVLKTDKAPD